MVPKMGPYRHHHLRMSHAIGVVLLALLCALEPPIACSARPALSTGLRSGDLLGAACATVSSRGTYSGTGKCSAAAAVSRGYCRGHGSRLCLAHLGRLCCLQRLSARYSPPAASCCARMMTPSLHKPHSRRTFRGSASWRVGSWDHCHRGVRLIGGERRAAIAGRPVSTAALILACSPTALLVLSWSRPACGS